MQRALIGIGLAAAGVLILASATMNYIFATSLGRTMLEGQLLGVVSVAIDILKALLAVFVAAALRHKRRAFVVIGGFAFLLFSVASMIAAAGFTSQARGSATGARATLTSRLLRTEQDLATLQQKLTAIPAHRAASIVEDAIKAAVSDRRFRLSKDCALATTQMQIGFCAEFFQLRAELTAAREAHRLDTEIETRRAEVDQLTANGGAAQADPQARMIAEALGMRESTVQRLLMTFVALVVEVSSGLGIYLATGHRARPAVPEPKTMPPLDPALSVTTTPANDTTPSPVVVTTPIDPDQVKRRNRLRSAAHATSHSTGHVPTSG